jgi:hypothetical protein
MKLTRETNIQIFQSDIPLVSAPYNTILGSIRIEFKITKVLVKWTRVLLFDILAEVKPILMSNHLHDFINPGVLL